MVPSRLLYILFFSLAFVSCTAEENVVVDEENIINGDARIDYYLPYIQEKKVAIVANHTSILDSVNLVDTLKVLGIEIRAIFSPEHGFKGHADAGEKVSDDEYEGIKIYSLYGNNKKPKAEQLEGIDVVLYDLQDVGARFYTYISTLHYVMEACAEAQIPLVVLDRPNPHGNEVDGPVLEDDCRSFVGMDNIPILYGLTAGELACMISGENWLKCTNRLDLKVVEMLNYDPHRRHRLDFSPSPNLRCNEAIWLYPSLCLFEGTNISVGRGTENPFTVIGDEKLNIIDQADSLFTLKFVIDFYKKTGESFWKNAKFFDLLAGTKMLRQQIIGGISEDSIRKTWQPGLENYKKIREKYLLYDEGKSYEAINWQKEMYSAEVDSIIKEMTLEEKIGQLIWVTLNGYPTKKDYDWVECQCMENYAGGVLIMQNDDCRDVRNFTEHLQETSKYPIIFAMDAETGVGRKLSNVRNFPLNKYLAEQDSVTMVKIGELYAEQLKTLGIDINFAPVVDVNTNPKNPVIGSRSFGNDAQIVADHSRWMVEGMQRNGCAATVKHFPGHGDTHTDSHLTMPVITNNRKHIEEIDLLPFRENVASGAMAVMTAHIAVPALDPSEKVASLSPTMISVLRDEMHFEGLIISDAMNMAGVQIAANGENAEAEALIAGNDVVEFCLDVPKAINAVKKALDDGRLSQEDLEMKVRRVLAVKKWAGTLDKSTLFGAPEVKLNSIEVEILTKELAK